MNTLRNNRFRLACLVLLLGTVALLGLAARDRPTAKEKPVKQVADFALKDTIGNQIALSDFNDKSAVVVVFIGTECPLVNLYVQRLKDLHGEFASQGVQVLAINSNSQDTPEAVTQHARERQLPFPVLIDPQQKVADVFGAERTPEAFLLDQAHIIRYQGCIDNQYTVGADRGSPTRHDLKEAIVEVLANKPVSVAWTEAPGCIIVREPPPPPQQELTYSKHIAPLLQKHCQDCHRPGQVAPFSLLTYRQARGWSETIREVVNDGRMPPWHADPCHGEFRNDRSLPEADRQMLLTWIDRGCPEGDPRDLPAPRSFPEGWQIGEPELVLSMKESFTVPAQPPKGGVPYQYFTLDANFPEDVWVQAVESRPGNRAVVHHMVVHMGDPRGQEARETGDRQIVAAWVPGSQPRILPPDLGVRIPKGTKLVLEVHYNANGREQTDLSSVGLVFAKQPPRHEIRYRRITNYQFAIPPKAGNHEVTASTTFDQDVMVLSLAPHMHLRGKSFVFRAVYPDKRSEVLLSVPRYDFNWQHRYLLKKPLYLPAGTRIECVAHFDNSPANRNNPDPNVEVRWGEQSWEEMMIGAVGYIYVNEPDRRK